MQVTHPRLSHLVRGIEVWPTCHSLLIHLKGLSSELLDLLSATNPCDWARVDKPDGFYAPGGGEGVVGVVLFTYDGWTVAQAAEHLARDAELTVTPQKAILG